MSWNFSRRENRKPNVPQAYRPVLEATEVIDLFGRLTLHHQAALLRLISRNIAIEVDGEIHMGCEFEYDVDNAIISVKKSDPQSELDLSE